MYTLVVIFSLLVGIVILVLVIALFVGKEYHIRREIAISAPQQKVFDFLKHLKNQDHFNKWVMVEPDMQRTFTGTDGTVGFIYAWNGKKAGAGQQQIKNLIERQKIETEIRFIRPFEGIAYADFVIEPISESQTKVTWSNQSQMKYPMNLMLPVVEKMLAKDMDTSLSNLKNLLEK